MPAEYATYRRLRAAAFRRRRCREMFGWSDAEYDAASARFCDWAIAFAGAEDEGHARRQRAEVERRQRELLERAGRG